MERVYVGYQGADMVTNDIHTLSSPLGDREGPGLFSKGRGSSKARPKPAVPGHAVLDALRHFRLGLEKTAMSPCHWGEGQAATWRDDGSPTARRASCVVRFLGKPAAV